ncbi:MAG: hydrogenase, partial [Candidatus Eiseniibacteriota bacterium]
MTALPIQWTRNGLAVGRSEIPALQIEAFREACVAAVTAGYRLSAMTVLPASPGTVGVTGAPGAPRAAGAAREDSILAVIADDAESRIGFLQGTVPDSRRYQSLSIDLPQAQAFEREILEDHKIVPEGHPWPKPLRRHADLEPGKKTAVGAAHVHPFFRVEGAGVHEVAVGPVHAGIIEPGHFRFQCQGEKVLHLETQLGYQHRGAEALFLKSAHARRLVVAESLAGDTALGHALAYCAAMEGLSRTEAPLAAQAPRGLARE